MPSMTVALKPRSMKALVDEGLVDGRRETGEPRQVLLARAAVERALHQQHRLIAQWPLVAPDHIQNLTDAHRLRTGVLRML